MAPPLDRRQPPQDKTGVTQQPLRLGSRASPLARAQTSLVAAALARTGITTVEAHVDTAGDRDRVRPLVELGGKAVWTKELDEALLDGRIDAAVHSLKDVETRLPDGLALVAVLPRADPRDRLIGAASLAALPPGARVGTSSPRRAAQLRARRPDCEPVLLRGNVATRLARVAEGAIAASFLAAAGLDRLGVEAGAALEIADWLPAASQGIVGITARADDETTRAALAAIDDSETHLAALAERAVLSGIGGSCRTALAAHAHRGTDGRLHLAAELMSPDGAETVRAADSAAVGNRADAEALGAAIAARLLDGASEAIRASL
jgi:hydroxymethylbilane synthase